MRKRGAVLAAGSLLLGLALVPLSASASAAGTLSCRATPTYPDVWNVGFDFQFVVTNTGTEAFNSWVITFDLPPGDVIYTTWNASVVQSGQHVVAQSYGGYGSSVPPGGSVYGFGGVAQGPVVGGFTNVTCTPGVVLPIQ
ncbi:cellulose binding domain-containing protein [Actinocrinis sp.]|uniref:cellulose binding domain-containing protein n=1 Tax=Actinocrinis sp. TaxID=1920516 RepID=UPI002D3BEBDC|nr:cellulose binding domain-containing protein [Actinocrinis sp.]HZP51522.1 cellulose binding domain-containing protein [Actinocrinis sp.]